MNYLLVDSCYKIIENEPVIFLIGRSPDGKEKKCFGWNSPAPYFYYEDPGGVYKGIKTAKSGPKIVNCSKVETRIPSDVAKKRDTFSYTFESDVLYEIRCLIDRKIFAGFQITDTGDVIPAENPECRLTRVHVDTEVETRGAFPDPDKARNMILTIVAKYHNPNTGEIEDFTMTACKPSEERHMIMAFIDWIKEKQPDVWIGWNPQFDVKTIVNRAKRCKVEAERMSPVRIIRETGMNDKKIVGIQIFDLMDGFKKYFQGKTFEDYTLEGVASREDQYGVSMEADDFDYENYMNRKHIDIILEYNKRDVERTWAIDNKHGIVNQFDGVSRVVGCSLNDTLTTTRYVEILLLREFHGHYALARRHKEERLKYEGAFVFQPKKGLYDNVIALDFSQMYPTIIRSNNLSPETLSTKEIAGWKKIANVWVDMKTPGIVPRIFERLSVARMKVKDDMSMLKLDLNKNPMSKDLINKYNILDNMQYEIKQLIAAMYGQFAFPFSRLYVPQISECTTFMGRKMILKTMEFSKELGYNPIYGDTDSVLIEVGENPVEKGKKIEETVNSLFDQMAVEESWRFVPRIEFEKVYERILFHGKKKRYAGMRVWNKGAAIRELDIKGFEARRSDAAKWSRYAQKQLLDYILSGAGENQISIFIKELVAKASSEPLESIGLPQKVAKPLEEYYRPSSKKGLYYYDHIFNKTPLSGERYYKVLLQKKFWWRVRLYVTAPKACEEKGIQLKTNIYDVDWIGLKKNKEFEMTDEYNISWRDKVDWKLQTEKIIENKIDPILDVIDTTTKMILQDQKQTKLFAFA